MFTAEEPTRFGIGCLGSRLICKSTPSTADETLRDDHNRTLHEVRTAAGFTGSLDSVPLEPGYYHAFAELHIEQGPLLEQRGIPLGVVRAIAAPASLRVVIEGQGGHAGAVLMPDRHDAFLAAAEIALTVELAARSTGAIDSVATTGICEVFPGAINSIPSRVRLGFDIRDTDEARRDTILQSLEHACQDTETRRGVKTTIEPINRDAPCVCSPIVVDALTEACKKHELAFDTMVSRAYHDSLFMSRICPAAMLFIPCRNGFSHRPDEYASPEDIARGTLVLAEALAALAS
jgi:N-carbamoyl-L-amino-acid hydrolase